MISWRAALGLPFSALQLASGAKSFRDNPLIGSVRLNELGLHAGRVRLAHALAASRRRRLAPMISAAHRAEFDRQGFVLVENLLPDRQFQQLRDRVLSSRRDAREMVQGDTITRRIALNAGFLRDAPEVRSLVRSPQWRGLMRYASSFDVEPLYYVQTILSQRIGAPSDPQTDLHADTFHPTMKAWYFLNDIADDEGPLTYVPGSHALSPARLAWEREISLRGVARLDRLSARGSFRVAEAELERLGLPPARRFAVPANTLIVADTHGFHARAASTRPSTRIEIWAYARRNPFLPWTGADPLSRPPFADRRVDLMWKARDLLQQQIGQPWRPVGPKLPTDE